MTVVAPSVNANAARLVERMIAVSAELRIGVSTGSRGEVLIDAGASSVGGLEAGLRIAEICMGGLGDVSVVPQHAVAGWPWSIAVRSSNPVIACLASQYAGWNLSHKGDGGSYFAMGSGPARALAAREPVFQAIGYRDRSTSATIVLEAETNPPPEVIDKVTSQCGVAADRLTVIFAPTRSLAGTAQVVARVLEVALHKAHELRFPLDRIVDGMATAPLSPPHPDFVVALGRTNDAIIYGGQVHLYVTGPADDAEALARQLPSGVSRDFGRPFTEIFQSFNGDFYAIDPMLFSPAEVIVTAIDSGSSFRGGAIAQDLLNASFA